MFPEGMAISPDGRLVVTVNIGATPMPPGTPFYSPVTTTTMWSRDAATGRLSAMGETPFEGILPEGAVFDPTSQYLAVASFHATGEQRDTGAVDIWRVTPDQAMPLKLERRITVPRGAHALEWIE